MRTKPVRFLLLLFALLSLTAVAKAPVNQKITVNPGDNGIRLFDGDARVGDLITVTFSPAKGYVFVGRTEIKDPKSLWLRANGNTSPHSFVALIKDKHDKEVLLAATFSGILRKIQKEGKKGVKPEDLPWKLEGQFMIFGDHEGVGEIPRKPPGNFVSSKPNKPFKYVGEAKLVITETPPPNPKKLYNLIGTFSKEGSDRTFIGAYKGGPNMDEKAKKAKKLKTIKNAPCPDKDGAKVDVVYYGFTDPKKGQPAGIAGVAVNDIIHINPLPKMDEMKELLDGWKDISALEAALAAAKAAWEAARAALKAKKASFPTINKIATEKAKLADPNTRELNKPHIRKTIAKLEVKLATAREQAKLTAFIADEVAKVAETLEAFKAASKALSDAVDANIEISKQTITINGHVLKITDLEIIQKMYEGLMVHEEGHRKICYLYVDALTNLAKTFSCYGYAPEEERANAISLDYFTKVSAQKIKNLIKREAEHQIRYDEKTDHGQNQNLWTEDDMKI